MADFIQTFTQLDGPQRRHALALLPAHLTPYEWRDLHAITSARRFHADIIGQLPIELVAHVFSYLDPAAPFRCQSVCRRWRHVLQSLDVLKAALDSWYRGALPLPLADYASYMHTASKVHRFRTGRPVSIHKIVLNTGLHMAAPSLCGDYLTWIPSPLYAGSPSRSACVLNLHTWQLRYLAGEAREVLFSKIASDQIVMLSIRGTTCYVYQVHCEGPPKTFRLPSMQFLKYLDCRRRTIACVASHQRHASVFIWDYDTQKSMSFDINYASDSVFAGLCSSNIIHIAPLIQPDTETITLLFVSVNPNAQTQAQTLFVLATYTFQGQCISSSRPSLPHVEQKSFWPSGSGFEAADDSNTLFSLRLIEQSVDANSNQRTILGVLPFQFNAKTRDLSILKGPGLHDDIPQVCFTHSLAWWKDVCYGFEKKTEVTKGDMITFMGTCDTEAHVPIVSEPECDDDCLNVPHQQPFLLNEKYIIRIVAGTAYLACFDESGNRPTADDSFFDMGRVIVQ